MVALQFLGVYRDHNRFLVAAKWWRRADAGKRGKHRTHTEQGQVVDLPQRTAVRTEDQLPHRDTPRIESHDKGRHGAGRHEGAGAIDVADDLRHRLAHIRPFIEFDLDQRCALNAFRVDIFYAGNVQEMVFIVGGDESLHLVGGKTAVRLSHVYSRQPELREDVDLAVPDGQPGEKKNGHDRNQDGYRMTQCGNNELHGGLFQLVGKKMKIAFCDANVQQRTPDLQIGVCLRHFRPE